MCPVYLYKASYGILAVRGFNEIGTLPIGGVGDADDIGTLEIFGAGDTEGVNGIGETGYTMGNGRRDGIVAVNALGNGVVRVCTE